MPHARKISIWRKMGSKTLGGGREFEQAAPLGDRNGILFSEQPWGL